MAETIEQLRAENAELRAEVDRLRGILNELREARIAYLQRAIATFDAIANGRAGNANG